MAVDSRPPESASFASSSDSFYPLTIPVRQVKPSPKNYAAPDHLPAYSHWQLRHFISNPEPNVLYYASGRDIFLLDPRTRKQKHIATVPFEARCTASGHGFVCVGGANRGHLATIEVSSTVTPVDAPLPLDHDTGTPLDRPSFPSASSIHITSIGDQIINSISIHAISDRDAHLHDLVAVLTNNDNTVRIYSLTHRREMSRLGMPFAMNHASISPDGKTLAAVGDSNSVFLFDRVTTDGPSRVPKPHNTLDMGSVTWRPVTDMDLFVPEEADAIHRGYFTTAWSQRGHLLAAGSEAGHICVIDLTLLRQLRTEDRSEAVVGVVQSSRPYNPQHMCPGAVRSLAFSPEPWDLLIWAEDRGRVCIADLRTALRTRQTIDLEPESPHLDRLKLELVEPDLDPPVPALESIATADLSGPEVDMAYSATATGRELDRWLAAHRDTRRATALSSDLRWHFPHLSAMWLRQDPPFHDDSQGLTAYEQHILESLRTTRRWENQRVRGGVTQATAGPSNESSARADASALLALPDRVLNDTDSGTTPADADRASLPSLTRVRAASSSRTWDASTSDGRLPRVWTDVGRPRTRTTARQLGLLGPAETDASGPGDSSSSDDTGGREDESAWQSISEALGVSRGRPGQVSSVGDEDNATDYRDPEPLVDPFSGRRDRLLQLRSSLETTDTEHRSRTVAAPAPAPARDVPVPVPVPSGVSSTGHGMRVRYTPRSGVHYSGTEEARNRLRRDYGVRTAGLALREDGRMVWVATEEGIFEITMDIKRRTMWSAVDMA